MRKIVLLTTLLLPVSVMAEQQSIDSDLDACLQEKSSTVDMSRCYKAASDAWDKEMNAQYHQLMQKLQGKQQEQLREAQRNWVKYRDSWTAAAKGYFVQQQGTMATISLGQQSVYLNKNQALQLRSINRGNCPGPDGC